MRKSCSFQQSNRTCGRRDSNPGSKAWEAFILDRTRPRPLCIVKSHPSNLYLLRLENLENKEWGEGLNDSPSVYAYIDMNSCGVGGFGDSPFLSRIFLTVSTNRLEGTGAQRTNSVPQKALPPVPPLIASDRSKASEVGSSPMI